MSENTYWGTVPGPTEFEFIEPGDYTDNRGTENDGHAVWMGESLVEGSLDDWQKFARALIEKIDGARVPATPEQIADQVIEEAKATMSGWANYTYTPSQDQYREMIVAAVNADRAQSPALTAARQWADRYRGMVGADDTFTGSLLFSEAEALADLLAIAGEPGLAKMLLESWTVNDSESDHYRDEVAAAIARY